ncbi:MAG: ABC transporter ATP-binding protein [Bacteroidales bacterium]|nr:ABC transporter ATP-binding protein [Bacteroidales bacterium]
MIKIEDIEFGYVKNRILFQDLNLTMEKGHVYGLLGKNGAGKTTLLKIMAGLRFPSNGSVEVMGHNACLRNAAMLQDLYLLQEEMFVPHLKVKAFVNAYAPFYPNFSREQFENYLNEFDVAGLEQHMDKMSQGQKKKVLVSFALAANTPILLMDEPTNGMDIPSKSVFRRLVASAADENRLMVISTHQVRDLFSLIDVVSILDRGKMILNASLEQITDKLLFDIEDQLTADGEVFYTEETPRGICQVKANVHQLDSKLDLEILFNALMSNKEPIMNLFK